MYVKADVIAKHLGVDIQTVYKWARKGVIPSSRFPGTRTVRFVIEEVDAASNKLKEEKQ